MASLSLTPMCRWPRVVAVLTFSCFLVAGTGCYGKFQLTRALYKVNGSVKDEVARTVVTALMIIFPVYWFGGLADWIVFNTIEFWTGKNPITDEVIKIKRTDSGEIEAVATLRRTPGRLETIVETYDHGRVDGRLLFWRDDADTTLHARVIWADGLAERYPFTAGLTPLPVDERTSVTAHHSISLPAMP